MKYILITGYSLLMQRNSGQLFIRNGGIRANIFYYYNQPKNNKITIFKIISSSLSFTPRAAQDTENWIMKIQNRTIM